MKNGIIIYESKYGTTKKYVDWLIEETNFDCIEVKQTKISDIEKYNIVILCGGIYASKISGLSFIRKNYNSLKNKKLVIFCNGLSLYEEEYFNKIKTFNLKEDLKDIPVFYGRGALDKGVLSFKDRTLCKMLQKMVNKINQNEYDPLMKAIASIKEDKVDYSDKKYLKPLIKYIS